MKTSEILEQARKRIEKPENWVKGFAAIDITGNSVDPENEYAVCFCAIGAICSVTNNKERMFNRARNALIRASGIRFFLFFQ